MEPFKKFTMLNQEETTASDQTLKKETEYLKLFRWKADGFPPMYLNNMVPSITSLMRAFASIEEENKRLREFKDYVHKRLDDAGIKKEPNGEHSKHGCRIGDRLDILLKDSIAIELALKIAEYSKQLEEKDREIAELRDQLRERDLYKSPPAEFESQDETN